MSPDDDIREVPDRSGEDTPEPTQETPAGSGQQETGERQQDATEREQVADTQQEAGERQQDATETGNAFTTATDSLLQVSELDAGYGDLQILEGVDLNVEAGEYVTIVGPNGAGKSTVMKSIFGLTTLMGGRVEFDGADITGEKPEEVIHLGLGYVPQSDNIFPSLSVLENLEMGAYILDEVPQDQLDAVFERFPILEERKGQKAGTLSGGQQQMLAMGRALMLDPDLLLLDEPSAGLAPELVDDMFDRIDRINDAGTAVLMVEQNAKEALRRCDRGYVLVQGGNRFMDSGSALLHDEQVRREFLGG